MNKGTAIMTRGDMAISQISQRRKGERTGSQNKAPQRKGKHHECGLHDKGKKEGHKR